MENEQPKFTEDDLDAVWEAHKTYFLQVLNGEYPIDDARADLGGLIGSKWDHRSLPNVRDQGSAPSTTHAEERNLSNEN
jgi:hypothetical protein